MLFYTFMKRQHVREPSVTWGKRFDADVPRGTDPDDALLLPNHGAFSSFIEIPSSQELKYYDTHANGVNISTRVLGGLGSDMFTNPDEGGLVSTPSRGNAANQRSGKRILVKNWRWTGSIDMDGEGVKFKPPEPILVHLAVVLDTQWNGSVPDSSEIYSGFAGQLPQQFPPFRNMDSSSRFQVLKSEIIKVGRESFTIDSTAVPAEFSWAGDLVPFDFFVPAEFFIEFNGSAAGNASAIQDRAIYLIANQSGGQQCTIDWHFRIRFYDAVD